jgi:CheY-like chemotaxis protein
MRSIPFTPHGLQAAREKLLPDQREDRAAMPRKIMVVDDDPGLIGLIQLMLERWSDEYVGTSNPEQALALARETLPDLILLDDMMPVMHGFVVMQHLRSDPLTQHIPIVFISARARSAFEHILCAENEPIGYLCKPFTPSMLRESLDEFLAE